jgi:hypothetical protein
MTDEVKAEVIKAIAFGCPDSVIRDNTEVSYEEINRIKIDCAAEILAKKEWYSRKYGGTA